VGDDETTRTAVKTYVPAYQKDIWAADADELGMSQSEFVRTMVQAGRKKFDVPAEGVSIAAEEEGTGGVTGGEGEPDEGRFDQRVLDALSVEEHRGWETLLSRLSEDLEDRLEATLDDLQSADRVRYSGRHGGYTLVDDEQ
jgi:hypothetical protein